MSRTIGTSLVLRTTGLIFLSLLIFALGSYHLIVRPTIHGLAQAEMGLVSQQVESRIQRLFDAVQLSLRNSRAWGMNGELDHSQLVRFNAYFFPVIANHTEISSVIFADDTGQEILLLHTPDGKWVNRLSHAAKWGRKSYWLTWSAGQTLEKSEVRYDDYDAREQPWFKGAMALPQADQQHWTDAHVLPASQVAGITVSMRWKGRDAQRFVIAHHVNLHTLSRLTTGLQLGNRGVAALISEGGAVLGLPHVPERVTDAQIRAAELRAPLQQQLPGIASGFAHWRGLGQPADRIHVFNHAQAPWFSLFRAFSVGEHQMWLAVFAPEGQFIPGRPGDLGLLLVITALSLAVGSLVAWRVAKRFAEPLQALTRESERIGQLDLQAPVACGPLQARWREIESLAQAQETMRQRLLEFSTSLARSKDQLESKVRERTQTLEHQVALIEALLDTIPNPIFYKGPDSRFIGCNQAYESVFGINREQFIGKRVLDLDYLPLEDRQAYQAEDEAVIRDCQRVSRNQTLVFADGLSHHALYSVTGFCSADGSPGGLIGVIVDVSDLKAAEEDARQARALAEEAASVKAEFLANMSHEIRTPMNAVIGMTQLALQTDLSAQQRNYLTKALNAADGLLKLINDVLDFSKIEAGKMVAERVAFKLEHVLTRVLDLAVISARDKGLELLLDVNSDVPPDLLGDPMRLGQVLTNLVSNAVKFTQEGNITVRVARTATQGDHCVLRFEVVDSGIGIRPQVLQSIFDAFSQADGSTTRRFGGTGLGLSICKRIVEMLGGEMGVTSVSGQGSTFYFTVHVGLAEASAKSAMPPLLQPFTQGTRALVVDDNAAAREVFQHMLSALAFSVDTVANGDEALQAVKAAQQAGHPYRVALIDWKMPGMDGVETLRRLQAMHHGSYPDCVLATAHDRDELNRALGDTPVAGVLHKPVTASTLHDALVAVMNRQADGETRAAPAVLPPLADIKLALAGKKVLLVEDNDTNRELVVELLWRVGIAADVAVNGLEGVQKVQKGQYGLVLMDCQMPVMDGLEATRAIRQNPSFADLPVVALTANVLAGEREKCLLAGMSDYLAKPIDLQMFYRVLTRWLAPDHCFALERTPDAADVHWQPTGAGDDTSVLDPDIALQRMGGDRDLYERMLSRFQARESDAATRLRAALTQGDTKTAYRVVHNVKGLAGSIGAGDVAQASEALLLGLDGDSTTLHEALLNWETRFSQLLGVLSRLRQPVAAAESAATEPPNPLQTEALLRKLAHELEKDDASASRSAAELARQLAGSAHAQLAHAVAHHAAHYDYDEALGILCELARQLHVDI